MIGVTTTRGNVLKALGRIRTTALKATVHVPHSLYTAQASLGPAAIAAGSRWVGPQCWSSLLPSWLEVVGPSFYLLIQLERSKEKENIKNKNTQTNVNCKVDQVKSNS